MIEAAIASGIFGAILGILGWLFRQPISSINLRITELNKKVDRLTEWHIKHLEYHGGSRK